MPDEIPLYPDRPLPSAPEDRPTLIPYLPEQPNGSAMVILPGGAYRHLAVHEGEGYARWLNTYGITAFVLRYRLGSRGFRHPVMWEDATRAIRLVRAKAARWGLRSNRIGIIGSSAGGHLAATVLTHWTTGNPAAEDPAERVSSRPDVGVLCYPVISMRPGLTHAGSRENLLGPNPKPEELAWLSADEQITPETPPCFLFHTVEDSAVKVENSLLFALELRDKGVPFDLHIYQKGRHGIGLGSNEPPFHPWADNCLHWLKEQGFIRR